MCTNKVGNTKMAMNQGLKKMILPLSKIQNMNSENTEKRGYDLSGKLIEKYDVVHRGSFATREFVVEKTTEYNGKTISNYIKFQCVQDRTAIVDNIKIGDEIKVHFNIRGNRWERDGKVSYFTNLDAWRIESNLRSTNATSSIDREALDPIDTFQSDDENPLPF